MRFARYVNRGREHIGLIDPEQESIRAVVLEHDAYDPMIALIEHSLDGRVPEVRGPALDLAEVRLRPPIVRPPKNVLCIGKNYLAHAREFAASGFDSASADEVPTAPIVFTKAPGALSGAHDDIEVPWNLTTQVDYEGELGVVIGRPGRAIAREAALDHVWAYTVINDVTARDLQARHKQWHLGKSIDTFCPIGPWLTTADEVDAANLTLQCRVNGELRQQANTRDLIFDIPDILATLSAGMTLQTGDIIATGTPAGVGIGFDPPKFLRSGDIVEVTIGGLGRIANRVV